MSSSIAIDLSHLTETEIIHLAQQGNGAAFEHLYRQHSRQVYALCLRMTGDASEAEDLTQETFLQLFRKIRSFRGESALSTWLHRITFNIVLQRFRRKKLGEISLETVDNDYESGKSRNQIGRTDRSLSGLIERLGLTRAIDQLPTGCKRMFMLHDVQGYGHDEIAELLGCSVGNSKSQLHKAHVRLRRLLRGQSLRPREEHNAGFSPAINAVGTN